MKKTTLKQRKNKKIIVVAVSGGFDPIHPGHVRMFKEAKALGDRLVVIINNDNWIKLKKGFGVMSAADRAEVIGAFGDVDEVFISKHKPGTKDMSVSNELRLIQPDIYANVGVRTQKNIPGVGVLQLLNIEMNWNVVPCYP